VQPLYDGPQSDVLAVGDFLTGAEAETWVAYGEARGFELAQHPQSSSVAHRDCGRLELDDEQGAAAIYQRLKAVVPSSLTSGGAVWVADGCASNIRLYRYGRGQRFGRHYDQSNDLDGDRRTFYTVLVYLNGGERERSAGAGGGSGAAGDESGFLTGGATQFYLRRKDALPVCVMAPQMGACLLHSHGERCLLHEGGEVTNGVKVTFSLHKQAFYPYIFFVVSLTSAYFCATALSLWRALSIA
jgi:hypothetical protein